jgi:nitrite reductase (NADH) small subunit
MKDWRTEMAEWKSICKLEDIPRLGSRVVRSTSGDIAVFRTSGQRVFRLARPVSAQGRAVVAGAGAWQSGDLPAARLETASRFRRGGGSRRRLLAPLPVRVESGTVFLQI